MSSKILLQKTNNNLILSDRLYRDVNALLVQNFNDIDYGIIKDYSQKVPNLSKEELNHFLDIAKTNPIIQCAIATHPNTTQEILNALLTHGRVYAETLKFLVFKKELTEENAKLVWDKLTKSTKFALMDAQTYKRLQFENPYLYNKSDFADYYIKDFSNTQWLNDNIINIIAEDIINKVHNGEKLKNDDYKNIIEYVTSDNGIAMIENAVKEKEVSELYLPIMNNPNISPTIRAEIFDLVDISKVHIFTEDMIEKLYVANVDNLVPPLPTPPPLLYFVHSIFKDALSQTDNLGILKDFTNRCVGFNGDYDRLGISLFPVLLNETKNMDFIEYAIDNIYHHPNEAKWLESILTNYNLNEKAKTKLANRFTELFQDACSKGLFEYGILNNFYSASGFLSDTLTTLLSSIELTREQQEIIYDYLISESQTGNGRHHSALVRTLILSPNISEDLLDKIAENCDTPCFYAPSVKQNNSDTYIEIFKALKKCDLDASAREIIGNIYSGYAGTISYPIEKLDKLEKEIEILKKARGPELKEQYDHFLYSVDRLKEVVYNEKVHNVETEKIKTTSNIHHQFQLYLKLDKLIDIYNRLDKELQIATEKMYGKPEVVDILDVLNER